jgi:hypothetical protein
MFPEATCFFIRRMVRSQMPSNVMMELMGKLAIKTTHIRFFAVVIHINNCRKHITDAIMILGAIFFAVVQLFLAVVQFFFDFF